MSNFSDVSHRTFATAATKDLVTLVALY